MPIYTFIFISVLSCFVLLYFNRYIIFVIQKYSEVLVWGEILKIYHKTSLSAHPLFMFTIHSCSLGHIMITTFMNMYLWLKLLQEKIKWNFVTVLHPFWLQCYAKIPESWPAGPYWNKWHHIRNNPSKCHYMLVSLQGRQGISL